MFKKLTTYIGAGVGLAVTTLLFLGPRHCIDLMTTQRERIMEQTAPWVDPAVEFNSAVQEAEKMLPKQVAALKLGIHDTEKEMAAQVQAKKRPVAAPGASSPAKLRRVFFLAATGWAGAAGRPSRSPASRPAI